MSTYLYRLGQFAVGHRRSVIGGWLVLLAILGGLAAGFGKTANSALTIPGVESVSAATLLAERFPGGDESGAAARVVFAAPQGRSLTDPSLKAAVEQVVTQVQHAPQIATVADPYVAKTISTDGSVAYAAVQYQVSTNQIEDSSRRALLDTAATGRAAGLRVEFGGEAVQASSSGSTEGIGVLIAMLVLAVTFGSVVAAGLPLLTAMVGVGVGLAGITALSAVVNLSSTAPVLALMMGLAVGIDYALFIVSRHRQNLAAGLDADEAAARAVATAGGAVVFAGLTVVIALSALSIIGIPFLTVMGLAAAGTVAVAVLVAITLVPALLGFAGNNLNRWRLPFVPAGRRLRDRRKPNFGTRWAGRIVKRPVPVLMIALVALGVISLPALSLRLGLPDNGSQPATSTARQAYDTLATGFGPGVNGPLIIVIDAAKSPNPTAAAAEVRTVLAAQRNVTEIGATVFNPASNTATIRVIPATGPNDAATGELVNSIRHHQSQITADTGARMLVTGNTTLGLDISTKLSNALPLFLLVVVGLSLILLTIVFRSIWVPVKATLGFLLSICSAFGALVAVFQWGWLAGMLGVDQTGPVISFLPVLLIGLLFGLAMDYELFLVTRMREAHMHGGDAKHAVVGGFTDSARVVTAAAIIMTSVFAGFILGDDATIKSVGFALAFGVLVDAFVVRMTIVPAVMALLGARAWSLPRWLDRVVPDVDIEGVGLTRRLALQAAELDELPTRELVTANR